MFRSKFAEEIFHQKYAHQGCETWAKLTRVLWHEVCDGLLPKDIIDDGIAAMTNLKITCGGRYIYYAGRGKKFYNNCFLGKCEEDSREDWALRSFHAESVLMTGGGYGCDYSVYREEGALIRQTGGIASGPMSKMKMINEIGRYVMQGGSRRSALYASLGWQHKDAKKFLTTKDWDTPIKGTNITVGDAKRADFNFHAPLDFTNISLNYDDAWLNDPLRARHPTFVKNIAQALKNGEPGFSFNFGSQQNETGRNPCCEVVSEDDSDVCNLGSVNFGRIESLEELKYLTSLLVMFLMCGGIRGELPYDKVYSVRKKNNRIGCGLMGLHEWAIQRRLPYGVNPELTLWLDSWKAASDKTAKDMANRLNTAQPKGVRSVAPTGTIGLMADTSTGIEPIFAVAYKRRFLKEGTKWHYSYVVDATAQHLIDQYGTEPDSIETALSLSSDFEKRLELQACVQTYTDMAISSTINLPAWGTEQNNESHVEETARVVSKYAPHLRGLTFYPDSARGGQPLTAVPYAEARGLRGEMFLETTDVCDLRGGGSCGS